MILYTSNCRKGFGIGDNAKSGRDTTLQSWRGGGAGDMKGFGGATLRVSLAYRRIKLKE